MKKLTDFTHSEQKKTPTLVGAKLTLPLMFFLPLIPHTPTDTKSKINHKINKKNQPLEQNRWIGVDGNQ